jgi:glycosyltransferase involved in cell wall biosynthesis
VKPISVVIPTARQPAFLDYALRSVARQTIAHEIEEVLVSENLGDPGSRAVCERFPQLPIRYVLQEPPLTPVQNYQYVLRESKADLIAFLCDDDWWGSGHLQAGMSAHENNAGAVAWFSACLYSTRDVPQDGWVFRPPGLWLAAGKPDFTSVWSLDLERLLAVCWILTPFHFSSMVLRRRPAMKALPAMIGTHAYQVDRLYFSELAAGGTTLYEPLPDTFVRWREDNVTMRVERTKRDAMFRKTTGEIWSRSERRRVDLAAAWHSYIRDADPEVLEDVGRCFRRAMDEATLIKHGFGDFILPSLPRRALLKAARAGKAAISRRLRRRAR